MVLLLLKGIKSLLSLEIKLFTSISFIIHQELTIDDLWNLYARFINLIFLFFDKK